jgi:hypothetical protein
MMSARRFSHAAGLLGVGLAAWLGGAAVQRGPARAAEPAAGVALRHQFMNNLDARKQVPDARGYVSVTFPSPLTGSPTVLLQCANPRYTAKVHGVTAAGFVFALYRTRDLLDGEGVDPFNGPKAAKPVIAFRDAENIDVAWIAVTN